jgi:protein O-GlcNAc transferase
MCCSTTAADSLWAGLPILTMLNGRRMTSRVASSLLTAMNVTELIARDWDEYENLAVRLATDNNFYNETKKKIIANRMHSPAFDTQLWIQNFEKALETVWSIYQQQQPPRDIRVRDFL